MIYIDDQSIHRAARSADMSVYLNFEFEGEFCVGVVGSVNQMAQFFVDLARTQDNVAFQLAEVMRRTPMPNGETLWYFPGFDFPDEDVIEEELAEEVGSYEDEQTD